MPQTSYAFAVARIRALENRLLSRDRIERMVDASTAADVVKILIENEYGNETEIADAADYELLLGSELSSVYQLITAITPDQEATDLFFLKYDFHNLKVLLKARYLEEAQDNLLSERGTLPADVVKNAVTAKDYRMLPPSMREALDILDNRLSLKVDPLQIETVLDHALYTHISVVAGRKKDSFLRQYFIKQVDLLNLRTLLRVKKMEENVEFLKQLLLPGGSLAPSFFNRAMEESHEQLMEQMAYGDYAVVTAEGIQALIKDGSLTVYERSMDDYLLDYARSKRNNPFGMEAILGYLLAKENEVKLVRMILVAKINDLDTARIRERLRDVYV